MNSSSSKSSEAELGSVASLFFAHKLTDRQKTTIRLGAALTVLAAILGSLSLAQASSTAAATNEAEAPALPVSVTPIRWQSFYESEREFSGEVRARRSGALAFERPGRILAVLVTEGQAVKPGEVLAELERKSLDAQLAGAEAELGVASAVLAELEAGPRREQIEAARARLKALQAQLSVATRRAERVRRLRESLSSSAEQLDEVEGQQVELTARCEAAGAELRELEAGARKEQIDAQRARLAQLRASRQAILTEIEKSTLRAPYEGVIARRYQHEGAVVGAAAPILFIYESAALESRIGLPPQALQEPGLQVGQRVALRAADSRVQATVLAQSPELDPQTRTASLILSLEGPLRVGELLRIKIRSRVEARGVWLPSSALSRGRRGLWCCTLVGLDGRAERCEAELITSDGERAFLRLPAAEGRLVINASQRVVPGQRVRPVS